MRCRWLILSSVLCAACSRDTSRDARVPAATATGTASPRTNVDVASIRTTLLQENPEKADVLRRMEIREDDAIVTLRGVVADEQLHDQLIARVRTLPGVLGVRDELRTTPHEPAGETEQLKDKGTMTVISPVEIVRVTMLRERPEAADVIRSLTITEKGDVIELRGTVPDEATRRELIHAARKGAQSRAKSVDDDLTIGKEKR